MSKSFTIISVILLVVLIFSYIPTRATMAQTSSIVRGISCVAGGIAGSWLSGLIKTGLYNLTQKFKSLIPWLGIQQVPTNDADLSGVNHFENVIASCVARVVLNKITNNMIGAVRTSGKNGGPSFVRDWRNYLTGAQYRGENIFRSMLSTTNLCSYMSREIKTLFNANNRQSLISQNAIAQVRIDALEPFAQRNNCTMPQNFSLQSYVRDFSGNGGWEALARITQPENNFFGTFFNSMDEVARQRNFEQNADQLDALANGSFTSRRANSPGSVLSTNATPPPNAPLNSTCNDCINAGLMYCPSTGKCATGPGDPNCDGDETGDTADCAITVPSSTPRPANGPCAIIGRNGQCLVYEQIVTPGSTLRDTANNVINQELAWITNSRTLSSLISDLTNLLLSRILNLADGSKAPRQPGFTTQPEPSYPPNTGGPSPTPSVPPGSVALCVSVNYQDGCEIFSADDPDLTNNTIGNDTASSIIVGQGAAVEVCTNSNYGGDCIPFTANEPDFTNVSTGIFSNLNDEASSIRFTSTVPVTCQDKGLSDPYLNDVKAAINQFLAANPAIANSPNTDLTAVAALRDGVGQILESQGFTTGGINGPNGQPYEVLIAIYRPGDPDATIYRVATSLGSGALIKNSVQNIYCDDHTDINNLVPLPYQSNQTCSTLGLSNNYATDVQTAVNNVVNNTTLDDGQLGNSTDMGAFLDAVVIDLRNAGLKAGRVETSGILMTNVVIVGQPSDPDGTIYSLFSRNSGRIGDFIAITCARHDNWSVLRDPGGGNPIKTTWIINLSAANGQFLSATNGGGSTVTADKSSVGAWETFTLIDKGTQNGVLEDGDQIAIRSDSGLFFNHELSNDDLRVNISVATNGSIFTIRKSGGGVINTGDSVSFVDFNRYITAVGGGGGLVNFTGTSIGPPQIFTITIP